VYSIDELSGQIDLCCDLLDVGIKRGLEELGEFHKQMEAWKVCILNSYKVLTFTDIPDLLILIYPFFSGLSFTDFNKIW